MKYLKIKQFTTKKRKKYLIILNENLIILLANKKIMNFFNIKKKFLYKNVLIHIKYEFRKIILPKLKQILYINKIKKNLKNKSKIAFSVYPNNQIEIIFQEKSKKIVLNINNNSNNKNKNDLNTKSINDISHELRTPLSNIKSFLETLYEYKNELTNQQILEFLEISISETDRLNKLVNDILGFNQLVEEEVSTFLLKNVIEQILQLNRIRSINKKIILENNIIPNALKINNNINFINIIISNLLNNSIKFTYPNGIIYIEVKIIKLLSKELSTKHKIRVCVIDTGIGIPKRDIVHIFHRFSRVEKSKNVKLGAGLGLAIVKEYLNKQNNILNISTLPGKGTRISFNINLMKQLEKGLEPATY